MNKKIKKWLVSLFGLLLSLLLAAVLVTQTEVFRTWLRTKIEHLASGRLRPDFKIGKIGGNLLSSFELEKLLISENSDTLLYLPRLQFRILPGKLLSKELQLKIVSIDSLQLFLKQNEDRRWQFQQIVVADTTVAATGENTGLKWKIVLQNMRVKAASLKINPLAEMHNLPQQISNCDLILDALVDHDSIKIGIHELKFSTDNPQIALQEFACSLNYFDDEIIVESIDLKTKFSRLTGEMQYKLHTPDTLTFNLFAEKFALKELNPFFEQQILFGAPAVKLQGSLADDSLSVALDVSEYDQNIGLTGTIHQVSNFDDYRFAVNFHNFAPGKWLAKDSLDLVFDGEMHAQGSALDLDSLKIASDLQLRRIKMAGRTADSLQADLDFNKGNLLGHLDLFGPFGQLQLTGNLDEIGKKQKFSLNLKVANFDLNPLWQTDSLPSDFDFDFTATGQNLNPDSMQTSFKFAMRPSSVVGIDIDTLFSRGEWNSGAGAIDTLQIESALGRFFLAGELSLQAQNDLRFRGELGNLQWAKMRLAADTLEAGGFLAGRILGDAKALALRANFQLNDLTYNQMAAKQIFGKINGKVAADNLSAAGSVDLQKLMYAGTTMDSANLHWHFADSIFSAKFDFARRDTINGNVDFEYRIAENPVIQLNSLKARIKNMQWHLDDAPAMLQLGPDFYKISNAIFRSDSQKIRISGTINESGTNDLRIKVHALEVKPLAEFVQFEEEFSGQFFADFHIAGQAGQPQFDGDLVFVNGKIMEFDFEKFAGELSLFENELHWDFTLNQDSLRGMQFDGFLPFNLAAKNDVPMIPENSPLRFHAINTRRGGLDLAFLQAFIPDMRNVKGRFLANVLVSNTLNNPLPAGSVRVFDGEFDIPRYGIRYKNVQIATILDSTEIQIQQLDLHGGDGVLSVSGQLSFEDGLHAGLQAANLNLSAKDFQVAKNRDIFMVVDADARLFGNVESPAFDGDVTVRRSTLNLNALENSRYVEVEQMPPLLEQARSDSLTTPIISNAETSSDRDSPVDEVSRFYENLKGEIRLEIGRNTWLRSPALNVEVQGKLLQAKQTKVFEMPVGVVSVVRGSYDFLGKNFKITSGEFTLDGGDEINPLIELEAVYSIRDADRNKIRILVSGRVLDPKIKFYFNNEEIEESNAVSYIVFGRNLEQVSSGERQDLQSGQLLTQLAAAQLGKTLGKKLSLDVIEFQGKSEGDEASSITVGRYISDHIFISIQQLIGGENWETMEGLRATLELELRKNIFMQFTKGDEKSTGFDLIWKYQK